MTLLGFKTILHKKCRSGKNSEGPAENSWVMDLCSAKWKQISKVCNISKHSKKKVVTTKYLAKFQSPKAITRPKIIGPERNVNLICNLSLYTHIPNIESISQSIAKQEMCASQNTPVYINYQTVKNYIYSNGDLDLWPNDPKINRVLPLPQSNYVVKFGKDPIYITSYVETTLSSKIIFIVMVTLTFDLMTPK
jgi:hypothetical protein